MLPEENNIEIAEAIFVSSQLSAKTDFEITSKAKRQKRNISIFNFGMRNVLRQNKC